MRAIRRPATAMSYWVTSPGNLALLRMRPSLVSKTLSRGRAAGSRSSSTRRKRTLPGRPFAAVWSRCHLILLIEVSPRRRASSRISSTTFGVSIAARSKMVREGVVTGIPSNRARCDGSSGPIHRIVWSKFLRRRCLSTIRSTRSLGVNPGNLQSVAAERCETIASSPHERHAPSMSCRNDDGVPLMQKASRLSCLHRPESTRRLMTSFETPTPLACRRDIKPHCRDAIRASVASMPSCVNSASLARSISHKKARQAGPRPSTWRTCGS